MKNILKEADEIVNLRSEETDRQYGPFGECMTRTANIVSNSTGKDITTKDCYLVLVALKLARESFNHKEDNLLDAVAYLGALNNHYEGVEPKVIDKDQIRIDLDPIMLPKKPKGPIGRPKGLMGKPKGLIEKLRGPIGKPVKEIVKFKELEGDPYEFDIGDPLYIRFMKCLLKNRVVKFSDIFGKDDPITSFYVLKQSVERKLGTSLFCARGRGQGYTLRPTQDTIVKKHLSDYYEHPPLKNKKVRKPKRKPTESGFMPPRSYVNKRKRQHIYEKALLYMSNKGRVTVKDLYPHIERRQSALCRLTALARYIRDLLPGLDVFPDGIGGYAVSVKGRALIKKYLAETKS